MQDWHDFSKASSHVNRPICLQILWNFAISWRKCVFKLWYSFSTFLTNFSLNPKGQWLHCREQFPAAASQKQHFRSKKCFNATGACSNDAKVTLPGQTDPPSRSNGPGMGPTATTPNIIEFQNCLPSGWAWWHSKICRKCGCHQCFASFASLVY